LEGRRQIEGQTAIVGVDSDFVRTPAVRLAAIVTVPNPSSDDVAT
jgi:hypothetical protein